MRIIGRITTHIFRHAIHGQFAMIIIGSCNQLLWIQLCIARLWFGFVGSTVHVHREELWESHVWSLFLGRKWMATQSDRLRTNGLLITHTSKWFSLITINILVQGTADTATVIAASKKNTQIVSLTARLTMGMAYSWHVIVQWTRISFECGWPYAGNTYSLEFWQVWTPYSYY